jgi:hypothetical protein
MVSLARFTPKPVWLLVLCAIPLERRGLWLLYPFSALGLISLWMVDPRYYFVPYALFHLFRKRTTARVESALLIRLGLEVGSPLTIGEATVTIGGILGQQPDRLADRLAYGPKLLMSCETLARTGLVQPGHPQFTPTGEVGKKDNNIKPALEMEWGYGDIAPHTTAGRALLSEILPRGLPFAFINKSLKKKEISRLINASFRRCGLKETVVFADRLLKSGFRLATST